MDRIKPQSPMPFTELWTLKVDFIYRLLNTGANYIITEIQDTLIKYFAYHI